MADRAATAPIRVRFWGDADPRRPTAVTGARVGGARGSREFAERALWNADRGRDAHY
jgi:hypothetical protein